PRHAVPGRAEEHRKRGSGAMRVVFAGGQVFDGTGAPPGDADVAVEDGRIVAVGRGLDGDQAVDCAGRAVLPGLFDSHVHLMAGSLDVMRNLQRPFSYAFFEAVGNLRTTLELGITTVRDAAGADLGMKQAQADGLVAGP